MLEIREFKQKIQFEKKVQNDVGRLDVFHTAITKIIAPLKHSSVRPPIPWGGKEIKKFIQILSKSAETLSKLI